MEAGADPVVEAVINSVLLTADEFAQTAAQDYWDMSATAHRGVLTALREIPRDPELQAALDAALHAPQSPVPVGRLTAVVTERLTRSVPPSARERLWMTSHHNDPWARVAAQATRADGLGRLYVHVGPDWVPSEEQATVARIPLPRALAGPDAKPVVTIVVPFRDRDPSQGRLRNVLACLASLGDQSVDRDSFRVVVVEIDDRPRWSRLLRDRCDRYVFAERAGHFNKAWGVNVGVVAAADSAITCILDGDILVDRDFVGRNRARFAARGAQAHWPFTDALCLDDAASHVAIADRCLRSAPAIPVGALRGVYLRRPPGHCVWLWTDLFHRAHGMDERFEGWGGEDLDFVFRLDVLAGVDRYHDDLLHLCHPRPPVKENGKRFYAGRRLRPGTPPPRSVSSPVRSGRTTTTWSASSKASAEQG